MASIGVISGASAFGGDHGGAERSLRRAKRPEGRTIVRLLNPLQDLPADTDRGLFGIDLFDFEEPLGIVINDLPKIGAPATRALEAAGYTQLTEFAQVSESELLSLHGVGPKAIRLIRAALAERGLSLRER